MLTGRDNNLNLIRMAAATGVLASHAVALVVGPGNGAPLKETLGYSLGTLSVWIFFGVSGLLVTQSYVQSRSAAQWALARVLRIYPALIVAVFLTVLLVGPVMTTWSTGAYFADSSTWTYLWGNSTLLRFQYPLPGVFETVPHPNSVNGSLWTLPFELMCYALVLAVGLAGLFRRTWALLGLGAGLAALYFWDGLPTSFHVQRFREVGSLFVLGAAFYLMRRFVPLRLDIAAGLIVIAAFLKDTPVYDEALKLALLYSVFWLAFIPAGAIRAYNRLGDYSYGLYIYAFPIQQTVIVLLPESGALTNFAISFPITLVLAMVSWTFVEKPALALKQRRMIWRMRDPAVTASR